eukprot:TRINITY_DN24615_c0_g1_i1.p1 TRINITY_DN24615_c0_g1~~TRINITY_DN24615_c0_g1_i1.p1  ORF type:complete len:622 (-),score=112.15 TRINITY_DN24615_c0_g1_i1:185-2020(-)
MAMGASPAFAKLLQSLLDQHLQELAEVLRERRLPGAEDASGERTGFTSANGKQSDPVLAFSTRDEQDRAFARLQEHHVHRMHSIPADAEEEEVEPVSLVTFPATAPPLKSVASPLSSPDSVMPSENSAENNSKAKLHRQGTQIDNSAQDKKRRSLADARKTAAIRSRSRQEKGLTELENSDSCTARIGRFVITSRFDQMSALLLLSNAAFMGAQVEFALVDARFETQIPLEMEIVDYVFTFFFVAEISLRLIGIGCSRFFRDPEDRWWNTFDFFIVAVGAGDNLVTLATSGGGSALSNLSILRVIRVVRIVRVLRIIRVLKFFQDLRILVASIASTLKTATFAFMLISIGMYMFGVAITQLTADFILEKRLKGEPITNVEDLEFFYGTIGSTIFTLFMTIAGGIDWKDAYVPMSEVGFIATIIYIVFVILNVYCVMNVITGIFCQSAVETAQSDKELVIQLQLQEKRNYIETLKQLFQSWDESGDGKCSIVEFETHLHDHETEVLLRTLEIEARDALALFELLDKDGTGEVDLEEFITGCITLRGGAKAVHMEKISNMNGKLVTIIESIDKQLQAIIEHYHDINDAMHEARGRDGATTNRRKGIVNSAILD